MHGELNKRLG